MSSQQRLVGIIAVWILAIGAVAIFYRVSLLNPVPMWALMLMGITFSVIALAATVFITRARVQPL